LGKNEKDGVGGVDTFIHLFLVFPSGKEMG
jgi:hypothetical protein